MKIAILYILIMGIQLFLVKLLNNNLSWQSLLLYVWCSAFVVIFIFILISGKVQVNNWSFLAIGAGILAGIGTILAYQVIRNNDLGIFAPIVNLIPLVAVILSIIFLKESLTWNKILSIILGIGIVGLLNIK